MDRPGIRRMRWLMGYQLDRAANTVDASACGLFGSRAAFHDGFGCVLLHGSKPPYLLKSDIEALKVPKSPPLLAEIAGPDIVQPSDPALKAALDHAFEEPAEPPFRRTKAVVVVQDGRVIAERYADGIGVDTPLLGFSMTKSVVNALIGLLTQQGLVTPSMTAPIAEWRGDLRREIEIEHLMRMTSGLALDETNSGFDLSSQMYLHDDMAGFAVKAPMIAPPGTRWHYSSATTQLLARIIRDAVGGPEQTLAFAWRELFNPLGMRNVTLEFDASGTLQGSTYMLASARDWARFGLLYLNDGTSEGKAHSLRGLGRSFGRSDARHRLRRRLLDQPQREDCQRPRPPRHARDAAFFASAKDLERAKAHRNHAVAASGVGPPWRQRRPDRRYQRARTHW